MLVDSIRHFRFLQDDPVVFTPVPSTDIVDRIDLRSFSESTIKWPF